MMRKFEFQLSLVSHYGKKDEIFKSFIKSCQEIISKKLLSDFYPYENYQVHGTIIGLEAYVKNDKLFSKNIFENNNETLEIDFDKTLNFIEETFSTLDLQIQFGGYDFQNSYSFTNGMIFDPYNQSFSIKGRDAIIKGWQLRNKKEIIEFPIVLDTIRRKFQSVNFSHKYHKKATDFDNDFFSVLGKINIEEQPSLLIKELEEEVREFISKSDPIFLPISINDISLLFYVDSKMPKETTTQIRLNSSQFKKLNKEIVEDWVKNGT